MDVREKLALSVCNATQKTNNKCDFNCEKKGKCAYCLVMAEQMITNGVTVQNNTEINDELLEQLRNAPITILQEEPTIEVVQEWISVNDRLPKEGENVLVFRDNGFAVSEIYMTDYEGKPMWNYTGLGGDPTHWMPLPQPPKGE